MDVPCWYGLSPLLSGWWLGRQPRPGIRNRCEESCRSLGSIVAHQSEVFSAHEWLSVSRRCSSCLVSRAIDRRAKRDFNYATSTECTRDTLKQASHYCSILIYRAVNYAFFFLASAASLLKNLSKWARSSPALAGSRGRQLSLPTAPSRGS
jgi:hypothetical protein